MVNQAGFSSGGVVYASNGKYVNFEPKGTDTIPAMLTPGEYVVNAKASQKNLGLLQAINSGAMSTGGIVYAQQGLNLDPNAKYKKLKEIAQTKGVYPPIETERARAAVKHYEGGVLNKALRNAGIKSVPQMKFYQAFIKALEGTPPSLQNIEAVGPVIDPKDDSFGNIRNNKGRAALAAKRINLLKSQFNNLQQIDGNVLKQVDIEVRKAGMSGTYANDRSSLMAMIGKTVRDLKNLWKTASVDPQWQKEFQSIQNLNKGGPVYASNGMLIPYRPKGTDTVPAMLTPGEFVVNRTATQQHLPALQAMNQGGRVSYLANGSGSGGSSGFLGQLIGPLEKLTNALQGGVSSNSMNISALGAFTTTFNSLMNSLGSIKIPTIPSEISFNMAPIRIQVDITGAEALSALEPGLQDIAANKIQEAINTFKNDSFEGG